ncbi:MAG TPA: molybdopterin-dependent oxidoreductase [Candidatus Dormibacteraeota bacterium]|nr:molybdopterin-dependent oxidoreductase [Candidatus Dormibacteraeota bacterium]
MPTEQRVTFCRICEALCGLTATVEDGRLVALRPDREHPVSRGYACPKGIAMTEVQNDRDRVLHPLRRLANGGFERVSWPAALDNIGRRLRAVRDRNGPSAIAWYMGNPAAFGYAHAVWSRGFMDALGSPNYYTAGSQDVNNRFAASALLYGSPLLVPIPDLARTRFLLMVGANPLVSQGSLLTAPRIRAVLRGIVRRGGRVVVVDPRRSETARVFEHVSINPDSDAWLLLSMLHVLFDEGLEDRDALDRLARGGGFLSEAAASFPPEATEARTGVPAATVRGLMHDLAAADGAAVYGRTGSCLGRFGTLVAFLIDALNLVTGNLDRPGGAVFGHSSLMIEEVANRSGRATYARRRSRIGGFPDVLGSLPASLLAREITTPGKGQIRALIVGAGNPVLSVPNGMALERALGELELLVSLDLYVNETGRYADYILPTTTFLERSDLPAAFLSFMATPFIQYSEPVVPPAGEAREEWRIIEDLARPLGIIPSSVRAGRWLGRLGLRLSPEASVDLLLRAGPDGDWFGLRRSGLSIRALRRQPHGVLLKRQLPTGVLSRRVRHSDRRVRLDPPQIAAELNRLAATDDQDGVYPLRLIGMRELRSHNSWMHNAAALMRGGRRHTLRVSLEDASSLGVQEGDVVRLRSRTGMIEVPIEVTQDVRQGTVALPHGWGHLGGWRLASQNPGTNVNLLASNDPHDLEPLAGMAFLNGVPVRIEPVSLTSDAGPPGVGD